MMTGSNVMHVKIGLTKHVPVLLMRNIVIVKTVFKMCA